MLKVSIRFRLAETPEYSRPFPGPVDIGVPFNGFDHSILANFRHDEYMSEPPKFRKPHQTPRTPFGLVDFKGGLRP
jgi:hypothetical protein